MSKFTTSRNARGMGRTLDPFDARDGGPVRTDAGYHLERAALLPPSLRTRTPLVQRVTASPSVPFGPPVAERLPPTTSIPGRINDGPPPVSAGAPPVDVVVGGGTAADSATRFPFFVFGLLLAVYLVAKE